VPSVSTVASALERLAEAHGAVREGVDGALAAEYQVFHIDPSGAGGCSHNAYLGSEATLAHIAKARRPLLGHTARRLAAADSLASANPRRLFCLRQPRQLHVVHVGADAWVPVTTLPHTSAEDVVADAYLRVRSAAQVAGAGAAVDPADPSLVFHLDLQVVPAAGADATAAPPSVGALSSLPLPPVGPLAKALDVLGAVMTTPEGSTQRLLLRCEREDAPRALDAHAVPEAVLKPPRPARMASGAALPDLSDDEIGDEGHDADGDDASVIAFTTEDPADMDAVFVEKLTLGDAPAGGGTRDGVASAATDEADAPAAATASSVPGSRAASQPPSPPVAVAGTASAAATSVPTSPVRATLPPLASRSLSFGLSAVLGKGDDEDEADDRPASGAAANAMTKAPAAADAVQRPAASIGSPVAAGPLRAQRPGGASARARPSSLAVPPSAKVAVVKSPAVLRVILMKGAPWCVARHAAVANDR